MAAFRTRVMLGAVVLLVACLGAPATSQEAARWTPLGPNSGTVFALARDPFDRATLLAGTYFGGVYRTGDGGLHWSYVHSPLSSLPVFAIAYDPVRRGVVYAGTFESGIFRSDDGGTTWVRRDVGLVDKTVRALAVDPADSMVVLAGTESGVFRTTDGAASWTLAIPAAVGSIVHDVLRPGVVYAATSSRGVLRSEDGGVTWTDDNANLPARHVVKLTFDAQDGGRVYAAAEGRAYRRSAAGGGWTDISGNLPFGSVSEVVAEPAGDRLFALTDAGVLTTHADRSAWSVWAEFERKPRLISFDPGSPLILVPLEHGGVPATVDGGQSWLDATDGMQNLFVGAVAVAAVGRETVRYAGTDLGVYVGSDAFNTAARTNWYRDAAFRQGIFKLLPDPSSPGVVFAGTERVGVWKSVDYGTTWRQKSSGLVPLQIYDIGQSATDLDTVYVAASSGLYRSRDRGRTWTPAATREFNPTYIFSVAVDPVRRGRAFFGSVDGLVFKTVNDGASFSRASNGLPSDYVMSLRIGESGAVYAVTGSGSLYASADDGDHWFPAETGLTAPVHALAMGSGGTMYAGTWGASVYRSDTYGADWHPVGALPFPYVFSLAVDPHARQTVYAGTLGVMRSDDGGTTWQQAGTGLPSAAVTDIAVDTADPSLVYASVEGHGVFRSTDRGATWSPVASLPAGAVTIAADAHGRVYAGTKLGGLFTSSDAAATWLPSSEGMSVFVRGLAADARQPSKMYAGALLGGVFKTTDGGESWQNVGLNDNQVLDVAVHPQSSEIVYAATTQGVMVSLTGGDQWIPLGPRNGLGYGIFVLAIAIRPDAPHVLYAATGGDGIYKSLNGGIDWTPVNAGLESRSILTVLIDPNRPNTIYAATAGSGVFVSDDGGAVWSPLREGLFNGIVTSLALDPVTAGVLYAGTEGGGVFRMKRP
jgi:photosystem II stability/assembly factor-like uncharacterized protein